MSLATADSHIPIDDRLFGPLEFPSTPGYRRFLSLLYGFQAPLEAELARMVEIDRDFLKERRRAGCIANDLLALGLTKQELPLLSRRQHIEPFKTPAEALGWMYVTERLMLSVEGLRERIEAEMPVVFALSSQFLVSYRHAVDRRWREFGAMLDRHAKSNSEAVIAGARAGHASLLDWIDAKAPVRTSASALARLIA